tara:strand:+ start:1730 stop:2131 length:402 start_codon:yes stop_codon:yes gene_type:complete
VRVLLDTNVLVAAIAADGLCRNLVRVRIQTHTLIFSKRLAREFEKTMREKFGLDANDLPVWTLLKERMEWVQPRALAEPVCRDADDDWVLATAEAGKAEVIVTGDQDLQVLKEHEGVQIMSPRDFLRQLDKDT